MARSLAGRLLLAGVAAFLVACAGAPWNSGVVKDDDIVREVERASNRLMRESRDKSVRCCLIVTSFANVDALGQSSRFGRMVAQIAAAAIADAGYGVTELLLSDTIFVARQSGEFVLTRDIANLASEYSAEAVVVGTYAIARDRVYVTTKLVRARDALLLSAHSFELALGPNLQQMLY
jgi:TolB-like protein